MFATFYGVSISPEAVSDGYWEIMSSDRFREGILFSHERLESGSISLWCAAKYLNEKLGISVTTFTTEVDKIYLTYIKRRIPIIVAGRFPVTGGYVQNSVIIKGYAGNYAIVNDPKGNALTCYSERMGENMMYPTMLVEQWVGKRTEILRISTK